MDQLKIERIAPGQIAEQVQHTVAWQRPGCILSSKLSAIPLHDERERCVTRLVADAWPSELSRPNRHAAIERKSRCGGRREDLAKDDGAEAHELDDRVGLRHFGLLRHVGLVRGDCLRLAPPDCIPRSLSASLRATLT